MTLTKKSDILNGPLLRTIILYTIPVLLVAFIQSLFNTIDMMVLRWVSSTDTTIASVGLSSPLISLMLNLFFGMSGGIKVLLARFLGAKEEEQAQKTISTAMISATLFGVIVACLGITFAKSFLLMTDCPAECFSDATLYMQIYLAAAPFILIYNFGAAVISTTGDSRSPLYYMLLSGGLNLVLNLLLCLTLPNKVLAVAIATAVSQVAGAVLCLRHLYRITDDQPLPLMQSLCWDAKYFGKILRYGLPLGLASAVYPIANLQIQTEVNALGSAAIAGNTASGNLESLLGNIASAPWGSATTVFVGQNLGAGNTERVKKSILYPMLIAAGLGLLLGGVCALFPRPLLSLYVSEDAAIRFGQTRMMFTMLPYFISCLNNILSHVIRSFGYTIFSTLNSTVSVIVYRTVWMQLFYPRFMLQNSDAYARYNFICLCFLLSWLMILVCYVAFTLYLYYGKFLKGKLSKTL